MTQMDRATLQTQTATLLPDNTSSQISPEDIRTTAEDLADSAAFFEDLRGESLLSMPRLLELTDGASIDWDLDDGQSAYVTLGGNRTLNEPTNIAEGMLLRILVQQDGTGSRTLTWDSFFVWGGGTPPTLTTTAHRADLFEFLVVYNGSAYKALAAGAVQNLNTGVSGPIEPPP